MISINKWLEDDILDIVHKSSFISIMIDESVDVTRKQNLILYVRVLNTCNMTFQQRILKNIEIESMQGINIFTHVINYMNEKNIDLKKIVSFGSDGASNTTAEYNGVIKHLKDTNPWIINIDCSNHRHALAVMHKYFFSQEANMAQMA